MINVTESGKRNWGNKVYYRHIDLNMHNLTKGSVNVTAIIEQILCSPVGVSGTALASYHK